MSFWDIFIFFRFFSKEYTPFFSEQKYKPIEPKATPYGTSSAVRTTVEMPNTNIVVRSTSHSVSPPPLGQNASFTRPPQVVTDADGNRFLLYEYTMDDEMDEDGGQTFHESYPVENVRSQRMAKKF